jgi:hypothetical protein
MSAGALMPGELVDISGIHERVFLLLSEYRTTIDLRFLAPTIQLVPDTCQTQISLSEDYPLVSTSGLGISLRNESTPPSCPTRGLKSISTGWSPAGGGGGGGG